jgi:hypothetical protein
MFHGKDEIITPLGCACLGHAKVYQDGSKTTKFIQQDLKQDQRLLYTMDRK